MITKIDIISGFLGAGKTTLINKLLKESFHEEKVVLIENEYGDIGIDGQILRNNHVAMKEITSGCICCTLVGDFISAIEELVKEYEPDRIIIEPSGVGRLTDVLRACNSVRIKEKIKINMLITLVDTSEYEPSLENFGEFFVDQIDQANTIIMTRTDLIDEIEMEKIIASIRELNPGADILAEPWDQLSGEYIVGVAQEKNIFESTEHDCSQKHHHIHEHRHANQVFQFWGKETTQIFSQKRLQEIFEMLNNQNEYGMVIRCKGIVQENETEWVHFDYVSGKIKFQPTSPDSTGKVCVIGKDLNKEALNKLFGF